LYELLLLLLLLLMMMMMCQAKRIITYLARAKPERLVDEIVSELRVCITPLI